MCLKKIVFLCVALGFIMSCSKDSDIVKGAPNTVSEIFAEVTTIGGSKNESGQSVISTSDGGYAILGFTQSMDGDVIGKQNESYDYWVLKFNANSELQWQKTFGGSNGDKGFDIIQTQDGGYALIGSSFSNDQDVSVNNGAEDFWFVKLEASGALSWEQSYGYSGVDSGLSVIETTDGGYFITGVLDVSASGGEGNSKGIQHAGGDFWGLKLNASGVVEWRKYYGGFFTDTPYGVVQTDDNGFILVGSSDSADTDISNNIGDYDFWVVKISETGVLEWEKSYGGTEIDEARAIVKTPDGNYVIAGDTRSFNTDVSSNNGLADLWLIKITPNGNLLWENTLGGGSFDVARDIKNTEDGGFLLAGSSRSSDGDITQNNGQNDALVVKVNSQGQLQWHKTVGGNNIDFAYGVAELNNKTIIVVGESSSSDQDINENKGFTDLLHFKID
ncbi:hypothetical protein ES677_10470 [Bizionia gelidisalsuginis]|uniref:Bulb-type lectin domain-containing protein n=2 Tax=Bizionia TaxID=283785 RepID=A0A8H2LKE8_9FLAO|nr:MULTISPECIES: hypothetical protein [Bizionia]TYB71769.1 hypothetical protein ES676_12200 [Bizionia saleffrena]TYC11327.1 hypothetical protein ES677_10470 [Bizionia gelidisalsuginis]